MGKYYGEFKVEGKEALRFDPERTMEVPDYRLLVVQQENSASIPTYFGFHHCNDATWKPNTSNTSNKQQTSTAKRVGARKTNNIAVDAKLNVYAIRNIRRGEELLLRYINT